MASICLYFQIHQPYRLRPYPVFEIGKQTPYFDQAENRRILELNSRNSYEPILKIIERLISEYPNDFKVCLSITGTAIEQLAAWQPTILERLKRLAKTGAVEFLAETYYHTLAFEYSRPEFVRQIQLHADKIGSLFGQKPTVFRNTELIFHNPMAYFLSQQGYKGLLLEGTAQVLDGKNSHAAYHAIHLPGFSLIPRNADLSEDLNVRFFDPTWEHFPLDTYRFAELLAGKPQDPICLGMHLELYQYSADERSAFLDFLASFPKELMKQGHSFTTPSELIENISPTEFLDIPYKTSWKGNDKNSNPWMGNSRQREALRKVYEMESAVKESENEGLIEDWSYLQSSDHFFKMATSETGDFSSAANDAYIHFMNLIADFQIRLRNA